MNKNRNNELLFISPTSFVVIPRNKVFTQRNMATRVEPIRKRRSRKAEKDMLMKQIREWL